MSIFKYEILNPVKDKKKPFLDRRGFFNIPNLKTNYKYYIECARYNPILGYKEYYILLSKEKFDNNCRNCKMDDYGRLKIPVKGKIKDFIKDNDDVNIKHIESEDGYDVFKIE